MNTWVRRTARVGILSAGFLLAGATAAHADTTTTSAGNSGTLSGNQISVPVDVPVNVCGNGIGVLGVGVPGSGHCATGTEEESTNLVTSDDHGTLSGNQVQVPVRVPVNVCDNGIGVLGTGIGGSGHCATGTEEESANLVSAGNSGTGSGNQVHVPVQVPVQVCGNGVGVLGLGVGGDNCARGTSDNGGYRMAATEGAEMVRSVVRPVVNRSTRLNHRPTRLRQRSVLVRGSLLHPVRSILFGRCDRSVVRTHGDRVLGDDALGNRAHGGRHLTRSDVWGLPGTEIAARIALPGHVFDRGAPLGLDGHHLLAR